MDAIPTGNRSWAALAHPRAGREGPAATSAARCRRRRAATIHGSRSQESVMLLDGQRYNQGLGTGGGRNAFNENDGSVEEVAFETGALSRRERGRRVHPQYHPERGRESVQGLVRLELHQQQLPEPTTSRTSRRRGRRRHGRRRRGSGTSTRHSAGRSCGTSSGFLAPSGTGAINRRVASALLQPDADRLSPTRRTWSARRIDYLRKISTNLRMTWMAPRNNKVTLFYENQIEDGPLLVLQPAARTRGAPGSRNRRRTT